MIMMMMLMLMTKTMMIRVDANDHLLVLFLIAYHFNKCFQVLFKTLQHRQLQSTE